MKKKMTTSLLAVLAVFTMSSSAFSADYTTMSTEELSNVRGTLYNATEAERNTFRNEWQKRINQMTPEERTQYMGSGKGAWKRARIWIWKGGWPGTGEKINYLKLMDS